VEVEMMEWSAAILLTIALMIVACPAGQAQEDATIVDEWASVEIPPPPELVPVTVSASRTALLVLDIQNQNCSEESRPRCVATLPGIVRLLEQCRAAGMPVVYSLTSNATAADIRPEVAPREDDPIVASSVDKFYGTELEAILRAGPVEAVIIIGTSAHGAVLNTATGAALRGLQVIVPVDGMSANEAYAEQYTAWHLANSPGTRNRAKLTKISLVTIEP
jgi:nicotinamidase-related amidase